jgi:hypothetical protein
MIRTWLVTAVFYLCLSAASARSAISVQPAAETIAATPVGGAPLANAEKLQLTETVLERIKSENATAEIAALFDFQSNQTLSERGRAECKTYPGDDSWPEEWVWDIFNLLLGNALIPTVPIAAPCYDSKWGKKDQAKCNAIVSAFTTSSTQ